MLPSSSKAGRDNLDIDEEEPETNKLLVDKDHHNFLLITLLGPYLYFNYMQSVLVHVFAE